MDQAHAPFVGPTRQSPTPTHAAHRGRGPRTRTRPPSSSSSSPRFLSLPIHLLLLAAARRRNPLAGGGLAGVGRCLRRGRCCICLPVARGKSERPCGLALLEGRVRVVSLLVWVARLRWPFCYHNLSISGLQWNECASLVAGKHC
jgi:hypothetical protein